MLKISRGRVAAVVIAGSVLVTAAAMQKPRTATVQKLRPITPVIKEVARPLPLSAVRLTGGPLKHAQDLDGEYLLKLEPDRMLLRSIASARVCRRPRSRMAGGTATART